MGILTSDDEFDSLSSFSKKKDQNQNKLNLLLKVGS